MRRRRPVGPWFRAVITFVAAVSGAGAVSAAGAQTAGAAPSTAASGIGSTWTTAQGAWATLPMGHLHTATNTFWQLLFRPAGASRWTLETPPGVASNGGIVAVSTPAATATVTVGFEPADLLSYSPVARTGDDGKQWSPGTLPAALAQVADAVATGSGGDVVALERAKGGTLVRADGSLTRWDTVTTARALGTTVAGEGCGLAALTAVTVTAGGPELGGNCTKPGVVGLFTDSAGSWQASGPTLARQSASTMRVLRLTTTSSGTEALVEARSGKVDSLIALWGGNGGAWTASAPVRVDGTVLSAGAGPGTSMQVLTRDAAGTAEVHSVPGPAAPWQSARVPEGTQAVLAEGGADGAGGSMTALAVSGSWITVWTRGQGPWERGARFRVPIEYGSST